MDDLEAGLYELLITARIRQRIDALRSRGIDTQEEAVPKEDQADLLARHVSLAVASALASASGPEERVVIANQLLELAASLIGDSELADLVEPGPRELEAVLPASLVGQGAYLRPQVPLGRTDLLMNARGEPVLAHELAAELSSADRVDLLCAFVKWSGFRLLADALEQAAQRDVPVRVITTTYMGATDRQAVDALVRLGAQVKISYDTLRTRLHAKAWLFQRRSGLDTAYIGSSNLSRAAMLDGLEWNVRVSRAENGAVLDKFAAAFDSYWLDRVFEDYDPERDAERLDRALDNSGPRSEFVLPRLDLQPWPFQQEILDQLAAEREVHGHWRNLVVAATGTGKTVIAALDYRRVRNQFGGDPSLLFVAHRREILEQSLLTFRIALGDPTFGELYVAGERPDRWRHVFASIQSLSRGEINRLPPGHFDVVIVDEFHHAEAPSYQRLLEHVVPRVLLGLTATPERGDGQDITTWFDGRLAAELRIWEALEQELLCPFHYFGIADATDLSSITWKRGGYDTKALDGIYTGNDARARLVLKQIRTKIAEPTRMRALGFCVSKAHAAYMARVFNEAGLSAAAVDSDTPMDVRLATRKKLRDGEICAVFSVDIFNEGVDVPEIDTVLFLRPTESATVFLQQLGRGLRHAPDKACLTVLDFIGHQNRSFRFDTRFRALTGASRTDLIRQIEEEFPFLPSGCALELDRIAQEVVLESVKAQIQFKTPQLVADIRSYGDVSLVDYLAQSGRELADIYRGGRTSWTGLRRSAGIATAPAGPGESTLAKRLHRFVHVDDVQRIDNWTGWLQSDRPPMLTRLTPTDELLVRMLFFNFWRDGGGHATYEAGLGVLWQHPAIIAELLELLALRRDQIDHLPIPLAATDLVHVPLQIHCRYTSEELLAGLGQASLTRTPSSDMQGVRYVQDLSADAFTFTLQKSEANYSPTTMYRDYAISEDLVHWESQSTTSDDSPTGRRYIGHETLGSHVLLFARETEKDAIGTRPFLFLGPARYVSHEGSRPIAVTWRLEHPMPPEFFMHARVLAA